MRIFVIKYAQIKRPWRCRSKEIDNNDRDCRREHIQSNDHGMRWARLISMLVRQLALRHRYRVMHAATNPWSLLPLRSRASSFPSRTSTHAAPSGSTAVNAFSRSAASSTAPQPSGPSWVPLQNIHILRSRSGDREGWRETEICTRDAGCARRGGGNELFPQLVRTVEHTYYVVSTDIQNASHSNIESTLTRTKPHHY